MEPLWSKDIEILVKIGILYCDSLSVIMRYGNWLVQLAVVVIVSLRKTIVQAKASCMLLLLYCPAC